MKKSYLLLLFFAALLVLTLGMRHTYKVALLRGKEDGYREGYLAGQADLATGRTNRKMPERDWYAKGMSARYWTGYCLCWPSGYLDGLDNLPVSEYRQGKPIDLERSRPFWLKTH